MLTNVRSKHAVRDRYATPRWWFVGWVVAVSLSWENGATLSMTNAQAPSAFPAHEWEHSDPEDQQVDSRRLQQAIDYLEQHVGSSGVRRMVIVRNGRVIWQGDQADQAQGVWSITKAFTSTAHGLLMDEGKCTLDTRAARYHPQHLARKYASVTLRHLATMTSGYDGVGGAYDFAPGRRGDQNALVPPAEPFFPPGTKFMYWDEATQEYGYVLEKIAGESLHDYLKRRVLDPIGITSLKWNHDATGNVLNWTGGIEISANDLARLGLLYLQRGRWNGRQLLSKQWVDQATRVQVPASIPNMLPHSSRRGSGVYGFHWWVNGRLPDGTRQWPHAPQETYCRSGYNNNKLFVVPPWNMVIVRLGLDEGENRWTREEVDTFLRMVGEAIRDPVLEGPFRVGQTMRISFRGPLAKETDNDPNPFLDYRLQVEFRSPSGRTHQVPGFFAGDGLGGGHGDVWRVRFAPDEPGTWSYRVSFRRGKHVSVSLDPTAGQPAELDETRGSFHVLPIDPAAPGFLRWGRLEYVGKYYLKFRHGPYWIKGGTDSPENLLAYAGFDDTIPSHTFEDHRRDWKPGDPDWGGGRGRALIGALNYLASKHVNSIYFLTMNVGGDGGDVWPWVSVTNRKGSPDNDNLHYDLSKLRQWEMVFDHAQRHGLLLHFVLNEAEKANKRELDNGELGIERRLYYRELIARFAHHGALEWNLCEEYNLGFNLRPRRIRAFADYIRSLDPYGHPIAVHSAGDPLKALAFTFGDERFSFTSIQLGQSDIATLTERFRQATGSAGRPLPVSMDEFTIDRGQRAGWVPAANAAQWRKEKIWPTYLSGGQLEFILEGLLQTESFRSPETERLWDYLWFARRFLQQLPFWEMEPADHLVRGAASLPVSVGGKPDRYRIGAQVLAKPGEIYAVYFPVGRQTGQIDLSAATGSLTLRWYDPRRGEFRGEPRVVAGTKNLTVGPPPDHTTDDWVVLIRRQPRDEHGGNRREADQ